MSLTTDPKNPKLGRGVDEKTTPQNEVYLVLSDEEIAKGLIRPIRNTYIHVGQHYEYKPVILDEHYFYDNKEYVATIPSLIENDKVVGSRYITQEELDQYYKTNGYIGGCGTVTKMNDKIAETYARDPKFYGSTYCVGCNKHLPVNEFLWDGTNEKVGS